MLYRLRDFHSEDLDALWRIDQQCFAAGVSYSRPELSTYIRMAGSFTLVAELPSSSNSTDSGLPQIAGFVVANANQRGAGHIVTIDVLPAARRSGVGSALLAEAEKRLQVARCKYVRLETAVDNQTALAFYKRHHYSVSKTIPRYYPDGLDAFVLKKDLLSPAPDR